MLDFPRCDEEKKAENSEDGGPTFEDNVAGLVPVFVTVCS